MEQELFKKAYNAVKLDNRQKEKILSCLAAEEGKKKVKLKNRFHMPAIVTACACIALLAGVPVIAANTGVAGKIIRAFNLLSIDEPVVTEQQKSLYSEYGTVLNNEIKLEGGNIKFEAVICDKNYICIPFSVELPDKTPEHLYKKVQQETILFYMAGSMHGPMGLVTVLPPEVQEDGTLKGCYLAGVEEEIKPGDEVIVKRLEKWDDYEGDIVSKFNIKKIAESRNIPIDKKMLQKKDMNPIYSMEISPLSLRIEGNNNPKNTKKGLMADLAYYDITVQLKDGTIVKQADTSTGGVEYENHDYIKTILFASPVDLSEVAGVRMQDAGGELWIPAGDL